jgi:hypothetical protein
MGEAPLGKSKNRMYYRYNVGYIGGDSANLLTDGALKIDSILLTKASHLLIVHWR